MRFVLILGVMASVFMHDTSWSQETARAAAKHLDHIALPVITVEPPAGYRYEIISTVDVNTGEFIWIVGLRPEKWDESVGVDSVPYGKEGLVSVVVGILAFLGNWLRSRKK